MKANEIMTAVLPEGKIVPDAPIARKLLKDGYKIIDIKPKRGHPKETIFVFENVPSFIEKLNKYMSERKEKNTSDEETA